MTLRREFHGPNLGYVLELYERYREDPDSVDEATRTFFESWSPPPSGPLPARAGQALAPTELVKVVGAANLAQSIRTHGYLQAQLNPLGWDPPGDPSLSLSFHNLNEDNLRGLPASLISGPLAEGAESAYEAVEALRQVYCSSIGYDYGHIRIPEERDWLREAAESGRFRPPRDEVDSLALLERLTQVETFEQFIHRIYPGKTRFSIEGLDMMVPMLDEIVERAAHQEICMIFLGMAHRGRLNVLTHVLGKPYAEILAEFKDPRSRFPTWDDMGWTGDVKYHKGAQREVEERQVVELVVRMPPNPSHLEHINPVIEGMARSADSKVDGPGPPEFFPRASLPLLIHGDASFNGEGIVSETLNMSSLPGYQTGGTVHIIGDNQLGFTAEDKELRSSQYASDLARGFEIPVIHVNADAPLACLEAARTALAYRERFNKDFVIDLIGYRRYGHNEGDEPAFTQPVMYQIIRDHPSVRQLWAHALQEQGFAEQKTAENLVQKYMRQLQEINESLKAEEELREPYPEIPPPGAAKKVKTAVPLEDLKDLNQALLQVPEDFNLNSKLKRAMNRRRKIFESPDEPALDWATAEELAFASILSDGIPIRMSGEDVVRGTFSQRHAAFYDVEQRHKTYLPLHHIPQVKASFEIINSPLTENAAVGYEFGYNIQAPEQLVIWEAQYGDFANLAQIMVDEFVVSGRAKWGLTPSLALLLPHGNEGQGPDHSSGRLERYLQLAAENNMRIAYPTTSAQYFHLLRRQAALLKTDPLPLVVFTPKGLLRHPHTASTPDELSQGGWMAAIDDPRAQQDPKEIQRLMFCTGRIYVDLVTSDHREKATRLAIARIEQLYPFPGEAVNELLDRYPNLVEVDWIQEEPQNMGAWEFVRPRLQEIIEDRWPLHYIGRPPSSSPAEGSAAWYHATQQTLIAKAFDHQQKADVISSDLIDERG